MPISFIQIRFFRNQNIGETLTHSKKSVSPMFWLQDSLIWMKEMGNWSEVHSERNNFLKNPYNQFNLISTTRQFGNNHGEKY